MKFKIQGLDCANCAAELERKIKKIKGVKDASISFMTERLVLELDDEDNQDEIIARVKKTIKREEPDVNIKEI